MTRLIINYRREDVPAEARRIRDILAAQFGRSEVVMDLDPPADGPPPGPNTGRLLDGSSLLVAIVGPRWLELMRGHAGRGERDPVREEIAAALRRGAAIIPVRVGREGSMPAPLAADELPDDIRPLAFRPGRAIVLERFGADTAALAASLQPPSTTATAARPPGNSTVKLWLWSAAAAGSAALFANLLMFVSGPTITQPSAFQAPPRPPGAIRQAFDKSFSTVESRVRRAVEAAVAKGRRGDDARRCQTSLIAATETGTIVFRTASAELDDRSHQTLDTLARIVKDCPDFIVEIEGHTDSQGEPANNQRLSERRARAVLDYLVGAGVPGSSLAAIGYGETRPVAPNDTAANMALNRRIDLNILPR